MATNTSCGGLCLIVEDFATATGGAQNVAVVVVAGATGAASGAPASLGVYPPVVSSTAVATGTYLDAQGYADITSSAVASGEAQDASITSSKVVESFALATSTTLAVINQEVSDTAVATGTAVPQAMGATLASYATATSSVTVSTAAEYTLAGSAAAAGSVVSVGLTETVTSTGAASDEVTTHRAVPVVVYDYGTATGSVPVASSTQCPVFLCSIGGSRDEVFIDVVHDIVVSNTAAADSSAVFKNPSSKAFVMNTETTAGSMYDNFDFDSVVQTPYGELAVGVDGIYMLSGDTDDGEQIRATIKTGFVDFGIPQTKRVDAVYFGYTSNGRLVLDVETYGSGHAPATYLLEQRLAEAPRNSRVQVGKGLSGRYWRFTIRNELGSSFDIASSTIDVAASTRRV